MNLLLVASAYPDAQNLYRQAFLLPRVRAYRAAGHSVSVLSLDAPESYTFEDVPVMTLSDLGAGPWDVMSFHAPNLRGHAKFLMTRWRELPAVCLTFHGHEIRRLTVDYPAPFPYRRGRFYPLKRLFQSVYDAVKLVFLRMLLNALRNRGKPFSLIFVSHTLMQEAERNLHLAPEHWENLCEVIPNTLGAAFEGARHRCLEPLADFITIRPVDNSTYCMDIISRLAAMHPNRTFHVYGEGRYFRLNPPPPNLTHFDQFLPNHEIPPLLDRYRAALMPSRIDSQGVMMCEMASLGMPLVASDIPVHREMLEGFPNVRFLNNERPDLDLEALLGMPTGLETPSKFGPAETTDLELRLFEKLLTL